MLDLSLRKMLFRINLAPLLVLVPLVLFGCGDSGPPLGTVSGVVTVNGQPGKNLRVTFNPTVGGRPSTATTDDQGQYELLFSGTTRGAMVGEHIVSIMDDPQVMGGTLEKVSEDTYVMKSAGNAEILKQMKNRLPAKYYQDSILTAKVEDGENKVDFDLKF